jgi:phospholipid/cholesterol/gamma-HCH transport system ATP-binding protein
MVPLLQFDAVTSRADGFYDSTLWNVGLTLRPGDLALVLLERGRLQTPLADLASGLVDPVEGAVRFVGNDWRTMKRTHADGLRGRIGRLIDGHAWISDLATDENIMLRELHHSARSAKEIREEADRLSRIFGLPGLPTGFPDDLHHSDLQRSACVRAFIGNPDLLILERPTRGVFPGIMPALVNSVQSARQRDAAVLWITAEGRVWGDPGVNASIRFQMSGTQLVEIMQSL